MIITYHGNNYFKIQSGNFTILVDPTDSRSFRGANLILNTIRTSSIQQVPDKEENFLIDHQGEYEVKDVIVKGWSLGSDKGGEKTVYRITLDDITILILGHLVKEPPPAFYENIVGIEVMILPAGGKPFVSETVAAKIIRQVKPALVIPSLFKDLKPFLKEVGKTCSKEDKLVFKAKDLEPGKSEVRCLK